ncbi:hypothetical protein UlMin_043444 [Ulmus minor]
MASSKDVDPSLGYLIWKDAEVKILCPTTVKNESQALEVDYRNHTLWLKYDEFEMKMKFINHAMNVWDHVITLLPRMDQLWINWMPDQQGWLSYIKFELRYNKLTGQGLYLSNFSNVIQKLELGFSLPSFTRCIYKFALDHIPKGRAEDLYRKFVAIEKQKSPPNHDTCFDYIRLEESMGTKERIRKVFEHAIANVSPTEEKWSQFFCRFMHLYFVANFLFIFICTINYAIYEELDVGDVEWTRECLKLIPHEKFSFTEIWILTYLEWAPENCYAWCKYAELEKSLLETERMQSIFKLAIAQPILDMLELLWKIEKMRESERKKKRRDHHPPGMNTNQIEDEMVLLDIFSDIKDIFSSSEIDYICPVDPFSNSKSINQRLYNS